MTRKEVHNILDRPRRIAVKIKKLTVERDALIGVLMPGGMDTHDRVQRTQEDVMARVMAEVVDLDTEIERLRAERAFELVRLRKLLEGDDVRLVVVSMSYLGGKSVKWIAEELHYVVKYVYQLRAEGLDEVAHLLEETEKGV